MTAQIKRLTPAQIITLGFALLILIGSILLSLPISVQDGVELKYIDALYTSTSAVCNRIDCSRCRRYLYANRTILPCDADPIWWSWCDNSRSRRNYCNG